MPPVRSRSRSRSHSRFLSRFLPLIAFLLPAGLTAAAESLRIEAAQLKALGIETAVAGQAQPSRPGTLPATVRIPNEQIRIVSAPVGGMVEMLAAAPGDAVRRGQVIARLASPQALELQRDVQQADAQAQLLRQNLQRDEQLFAEGLIPESRLQATRAAAAQAAAQAGERRQGLAMAGLAPGRLGGPLALTAPIDGVVLEQGAQVGERVDSSAPIYRIARLSPLWLEIQAPLELAAGLRVGMPVRVAGGGISGKLTTIGQAVDAASQSVLLRATLSPGAGTLRPGQVVEVEIDAAEQQQRLRVPSSALARHRGVPTVFVQTSSDDKGASFVARPVRVVSQGGDGAVIDGVGAGERIAVHGVSGLKAMLSGVGQD